MCIFFCKVPISLHQVEETPALINDHRIYPEPLLQSLAQAPALFPCHLLPLGAIVGGRATKVPGAPGEHRLRSSVELRSWCGTAENVKEAASAHAISNGSDEPVCSGCCSQHCFRFSQIMESTINKITSMLIHGWTSARSYSKEQINFRAAA